ncbi:hypothetical protein D9M68_674040 [compost metagenome]
MTCQIPVPCVRLDTGRYTTACMLQRCKGSLRMHDVCHGLESRRLRCAVDIDAELHPITDFGKQLQLILELIVRAEPRVHGLP